MKMQEYLRFINNKYLYASQKEQILFVEGYSDKVFYKEAFRGDNLLAVNEDNICINFAVGNERHNEDWLLYFGDSYRNYHQAQEIVNNLQGVYRRNYDFVIAATHDDNQPKDNCKIDSFGFIDRDFGEKVDIDNALLTFYAPRHIAQTQFHDRETSLIFNYLPKVYATIKTGMTSDDNERFVSTLTSILYFSACQGVLESNSIDFKQLHLYDLTHNNFRQRDRWAALKNCYGDIECFNFIRYLDDERRASSNQWHTAFIDKCKREVKKIKKDSLEVSVSNWLNGTGLDSLIEDAFFKANGHILWDNTSEKLFWYFGFNGDKPGQQLERAIINIIRAENPQISAFRSTSPIKEYIAYKHDT